jgi:opacity protein-like surface antigen
LSRSQRHIRAALAALFTLGLPLQASADWLVTPFVGRSLGGRTSLLSFDRGAGSQHWMIGGAGAWLASGPLGVELEATLVPSFFERGEGALARGGGVTTVSGSLIVALPTSVTQESLRPYLAGGLGLLHAQIDDVIVPVDRNLLGLTVGGGAIGGLSERTAVRFDLRHTRSVKGDAESILGVQRARLSFWRASVGLTLRY